MTRHPNQVTEDEIDAAEEMRERGEFAAAFALTQDMLNRAQDDGTRMRLLFDLLSCSTRLGLEDITRRAISDLEKLPDPEISRVFVDLIQSISYIAFGKYQEALQLIDVNLRSNFMECDDFQVWNYEYLAYRGSALVGLARCEEALCALNKAHDRSEERRVGKECRSRWSPYH